MKLQTINSNIDFDTLKPKTKIIWDSGFDYEIGYFFQTSDHVVYDTVNVELITGVIQGSALRSKSSIRLFNSETLSEMYKKYGCFKTFS